MARGLEKWSGYAYALLRFFSGALFACHGAQKLFGVFGGHREIHDPEGLLAGVIEFVGGLLIATGLFTHVAAFLASGEMAVAYFMAHGLKGFWPIVNRGELAVLYCFIFLYISTRGSGLLSLDAFRGKRS